MGRQVGVWAFKNSRHQLTSILPAIGTLPSISACFNSSTVTSLGIYTTTARELLVIVLTMPDPRVADKTKPDKKGKGCVEFDPWPPKPNCRHSRLS
ncbi:hypothetical protein BCR44DRAFT_45404 [Catenaria anguillulae PL171]|uniref:Uncharacterized protein n=1 Tax=Catenaria anguillulae PL171 TaxID=765915 RepID=A0A1Y2I4H2_9FUNG|nr:hypothetical protein BCR44DRAFT_45404 [Catenaria anguillulae PL171]